MRKTIEELGRTMQENLPAADSIKKQNELKQNKDKNKKLTKNWQKEQK